MKRRQETFTILAIAAACLIFYSRTFSAQHRIEDRITHSIEPNASFVVGGNVHPFANARNDRGQMSASFRMTHITMLFKPTDAQQNELNALLEEQQTPGSANYHQWLTPEQFADRFGVSANDVNQVVGWLKTQGFTVDEVGRDRMYVAFSGSVQQVETTFRTSIHQYSVGGKLYYANASEPAVPGALADVVRGFRSMNNFRPKPKGIKHSLSARFTSSITGNHFMAPNDFATVYDLATLYSIGLDGTGQTIAVAGQTDIQLSDIEAFRQAAGLPANDPQVLLVPGESDPGISQGDLGEADLDLEWSGAVAPGAHILYINSSDALMSLQYAVDQNLAPVVSVSYGDCEQNFSAQDRAGLVAVGQQANAQGITIVGPSGDAGAADCEDINATVATQGLAVDMPASMPYVTGMGGSEFTESASAWSSTNNASNGSALSYMPETTWNDTDSTGLAASGGGRSIYFAKPSWQAGAGVPNDSVRDVPDLSFNASPNHDGYLICSGGSCVNGFRDASSDLFVVGGTSVSAPSFAGVVALINQKIGSRQGNVNPVLYGLATSSPNVFHDIVTGNNIVPCQARTLNCTSGSYGFSAGPGYDLTTGLGSVDVTALLTAWPDPGSSSSGGSGSSGSGSSGSGSSGSSGSGGSTTSNSGQAPLPIAVVEQGTTRSGYLTITPDSGSSAPTPTVTYGIVNGGVVLSQAGITPTPMLSDGSVYADILPAISRDLGVAMANLSSATNSVTLTLRDTNGNVVSTPVSVSLAPQQQLARFVSQLFPSSAIGSEFLGSVRIQSSSPIGLLGLRFSGAQFSTVPISVGTASSTTVAFVLPQFAIGGGWATELALVNNNATTISGTISIFDPSGNPMTVTLNGATQSSFSYSISPAGTFLLAPRDSNGQAPF